MLPLCLNSTIGAPIAGYRTYVKEGTPRGRDGANNARRSIDTMAVTAPIMEPRETYLKTEIKGSPTAIIMRPARGDSAHKEPMPVALPFPPLNLRKIDQLWPIKTESATATSSDGDGFIIFAKITAKIPFPTSSTRTTMAGHTPTVRITLVIPVLPLPYCRTSMRRTSLVMRRPDGTDPMR
jgi:hypothetical protein